ncbi:MAG: energy-coupling factor ABC transporter permease [Polyangiaceae bacterium]
MHLPDGIVDSPPLLLGAALIASGAVATSLSRVAQRGAQRNLAWTGTLTAFVLALQAVNVPAAPGVSAHALGASLLTLMLGPAHAIAALACVVLLQALLFADGGVAALGINLITIAVVPVLSVATLRAWLPEKTTLSMLAIAGTTLGNLLAAALLSTILVVHAGAPAAFTYGTLIGLQTAAGLVEGVLTARALSHLERRAPRLLFPPHVQLRPEPTRRMWTWAAVGLGVALVLVPVASKAPDALTVVLAHAQSAP